VKSKIRCWKNRWWGRLNNLRPKYKPTKEQIRIINSKDKETLAEWWCMLNSFESPNELGDIAHRQSRKDYIPNDNCHQLMGFIKSRTTNYLRAYYWCVKKNKTMTDEEFIHWWLSGNGYCWR
jgi:hypothetical protein